MNNDSTTDTNSATSMRGEEVQPPTALEERSTEPAPADKASWTFKAIHDLQWKLTQWVLPALDSKISEGSGPMI